MSQSIPERADVRQLRIQAKELLEELRATDPQAKLADAQFEIARRHGFSSWPKLVAELEIPVLLEKMRRALERGDADTLDKLLSRRPSLRKRLDEPMFNFDAPPLIFAAQHRESARLLPVLVRHGADPNGRSRWWAGSFGPLDHVEGPAVDLLLSLGTKWDVWSAAVHGRLDELRRLLDEDPSRVNAPGGDGERPLHFAKDAATAELLIERGADLEIRDVDHESTPIQYQVRNSEVARVLLEHGATPDIFTAVALNDVEVLRRVLAADPAAPLARVGKDPFVTRQSNGGHIYSYQLGPNMTPQAAAAWMGHREVLAALAGSSPAGRLLIAAAWLGDESEVRRLAGAEIEPEDQGALGHAAQAGQTDAVRLLLEAGCDPTTPSMDSGSALHVACWFGYIDVVRLLLGKVPIELRDAHHGSTPLGWACHGAQWCRNEKGDYVRVVRALLDAGADPHAAANSGGTPMIEQAGDREDVKAVLREA